MAGSLHSGAGRGACWLHRGLKNIGVESKLLTDSSDTLGDNDVATIAVSLKNKVKAKISTQLDSMPTKLYRNRKKSNFSTGFWGKGFYKSELIDWADIIHLHWINGGFINIKYLSKIQKPLIWTMRDMWPMTGGCHYSMGCENYTSGCGRCPQLGSARQRDLSRIVYWRKKRYLPRNMKVVGISHWLSDCAKYSSLFKNFDIRTISNNIDCTEFFPIDKKISRNILNIPEDKKVILIGAINIENVYKGLDKFLDSLNYISKENLYIVSFGKISQNNFFKDIGISYTALGYLHDIISLRLAYSGADVFVAPSLMDSFGKTLAESMACGTPVVCFDATGPMDIVDHKENGYRAIPFDPKDLAKGIEWVLDDKLRYRSLVKNARLKVEKEFDIHVIAQKYKELYFEMTNCIPAGYVNG